MVELSKLLKIDGHSLRCDLVIVRKFVVVISLMHFLMTVKPITRVRDVHRLEKLTHSCIVILFFLFLEDAKCGIELLL